nr:CD177 antigen-like isoform X1 [Microcebus murinus]
MRGGEKASGPNPEPSLCPLTLSVTSPAPGPLRCPACLSTDSCAGDVTEACPEGSTHCYSGVLRLVGGKIFTRLQVQGCMSQPGCNLLNGTRDIGPIELRESCNVKDFPICDHGTNIVTSSSLTHEPVYWDPELVRLCDAGQECQETLLLIDAGDNSALLWSKGCSRAGAQDSQATSIHAGPTGVLMASYTRFCSSNFCNGANSSSVLLKSLPRPGMGSRDLGRPGHRDTDTWSPRRVATAENRAVHPQPSLPSPAAPAPGGLQCPSCVNIFGSCSQNSPRITCPNSTAHCYDGRISVKGGEC